MNTSEYALTVPEAVLKRLQPSEKVKQFIQAARQHIVNILQGKDERLLVIVGPCSIHDLKSTLEYASLLKNAATCFQNELFIVMRTYFEKPRTSLGWKGLLHDPFLDGSCHLNEGIMLARECLLEINQLGLACGTEFLDVVVPLYLSDLISWSVVGARTTESQLHRALASGLPMPVGFKNNTDGNIKVAVDGMHASRGPHQFLSMNSRGMPCAIQTHGNPNCHLILRGSHVAPNYDRDSIQHAIRYLQQNHFPPRLIIDCSHGNSQKDYTRQPNVALSIMQYVNAGADFVGGLMLESHLVDGKQDLLSPQELIYGKSITDSCLGWDKTLELLHQLASAIKYTPLPQERGVIF